MTADSEHVTRSAVRRAITGLPRSYWVLWFGTLVNRIGTMVQPFFAFYLADTRHFSLTSVGVILTVFGVGTLVSQPLSGWMSDRFGRKITLSYGLLTTAILMILLGHSTALPIIAPTMFLLGAAIDIYRPASQALVADLIPVADRTKAYGLLFWAVNLGFSVGVLTGGMLADIGIGWLFWINASACTLFALLVALLVQEPPRTQAANKNVGTYRTVLRDRVMVLFTLVTTAYGFVYLQSILTLPLAMRADGLPSSAYGIVMAANGIVVVLVQPLLAERLGKYDPSKVIALGMAIVAVGFGLSIFASSLLSYLGTVVVWSIGEILFTGVTAAVVANLSPAELRGRYNGVYGLAWSASFLLAPAAGTALLGLGAPVLWLFCVVVGFAAAAGQLLLAPSIRRRTASTTVSRAAAKES